MNVKEQLQAMKEQAKEQIKLARSIHELNDMKAKYLGKKGSFASIMLLMKDLSPEERPTFGKMTNEAKQVILEYIESQKEVIELAKIEAKLQEEKIDVTLSGREFPHGHLHLLTQTKRDIEAFFIGMGYTIKEGPEIEIDEYNFEKLNLPKDHPARDMQDSFYITDNLLLRTHTSPVQVRTMLEDEEKSPIKIICPGKVYRRDDDDATHSHQFMQLEGLVVDEHLFGDTREIRLRPSYFPFTEPSVEVDVSCHNCGGQGCNICKQTGWIEILGAGMVHNNVLRDSGYDPLKYQGFAFGMGIERIAMLKYGINDIRAFYTNDLRFTRQFK